ncbi:MAG: hypothetical protein FJ150_09465 [Euryarchaeota archaeon]|nr:hypothetical protein [Euryarchaeota archaeon]
MVDIKEIKHIRAAPFTLMSSSIHAVLAFIGAIILVLAIVPLAAFIPQLGTVIGLIGLAVIILWPLTAFFINIMIAFLLALFYNLLVPRVGGVKLGLEGDEVKSIPVVSLALIMACISTIFTFIIGLYIALATTPIFALISTLIPLAANFTANATNYTGALPTGAAVGVLGAWSALFWIILMPIMVFIFSFIGYALFAIFYNVVAPKVGAAKLIFSPVSENLLELTSIPVIPAALVIGVVYAIFGLIYGFLMGIATGNILGAIIGLITYAIMYFIMYFIIVALIALIYNFMQPRIGGIKLQVK